MIALVSVLSPALLLPCTDRRSLLSSATAAAAGAALPHATLLAFAADAPATGTAAARVTSKVRLEFVQQVSAEESLVLPLTIGLFGNDAPQSVAAFLATARGALSAKCKEPIGVEDELMARGKLAKKGTYKSCVAVEDEPVTYAYSQVWSIQRGRRVDAGALQGKFALREAPITPPAEGAGLAHDAAGLLSVRRGGGVFDFGITTAPGTADDDEVYVVIGRVLEGLDVVAQLDAATVVRAADVLGVEAATASREKACAYGSANSYCAQNKPLKKITLVRATVL